MTPNNETLQSDFAQSLSKDFLQALKHQPNIFTSRPLSVSAKSRRFTGANQLKLSLQPYADPRWYTFEEVRKLRGDISGQKGTPIVFWSQEWRNNRLQKSDPNGQPVLDAQGRAIFENYRKKVFVLKTFVVFNAEQISGIEFPALQVGGDDFDANVRRLIAACPATFKDGGMQSFYSPANDVVTVPFDRSGAQKDFLLGTLKELTRWTGHKTRLDREQSGLWGSENDAREELRSCIATSMLLSLCHVPGELCPKVNESYFKLWETILTKDPSEILRASRDAEKIVSFICSLDSSLSQFESHTTEIKDFAMTEDTDLLKDWTGKLVIRSEFVHEDKCTVVRKPEEATQHSVYGIRKDGSLIFIGKSKDLKEAEKFAEKFSAMYDDAKKDVQSQNKAQASPQKHSQVVEPQNRFWLGNVYDKDRNKFFEKIKKIKQAGGRFDEKFKRWYLPDDKNADQVKEFWPKKLLNKQQEIGVADARQEMREAMIQMGLKPGDDEPIMDGKIHRCPLVDDKHGQLGGSYFGYLNEGHGWPAGRIENFRTGQILKWKASGTGRFVSGQEREELKQKAIEAKEAKQQQLNEQYETVAKECSKAFQAGIDAKMPTKYLEKKGITQTDFNQLSSVKLDEKGNLMVPIQDVDGKIWLLEKIHSNGFKSLSKGGKKSGNFSIIETALQKGQGLEKAPVILICEGYSTGVSLALATKQPVVMSVDAGNLPTVAKILREKYPDKPFVICGDDDRDNSINKGRIKATEAAEAINAELCFPVFKKDQTGSEYTDFNDLACHSELGWKAIEIQLKPVLDKVLKLQKEQASEVVEYRSQGVKNAK